MPCNSKPAPRLTWEVRLGRWMFGTHDFDGITIAIMSDEPEPAKKRIVEALSLLKERDPLSYVRAKKNLLNGIQVENVLKNWAQFDPSNFTCELELDAITGDRTVEELAFTILHEATHARLWRLGFRYDESIRHRVELICIRRERYCARKLPGAEDWLPYFDEWISSFDETDLSDPRFAAAQKQFQWRNMRRLRELGTPFWTIRTVMAIANGLRTILKLAHRLLSRARRMIMSA